MLDAIFTVKKKSWVTNSVMGDLVTALQDLFDPHINLCGGGKDRIFDPFAHFGSIRVH